jgi:molybdate transport system substrate-binding protein
MTRTVHRIAVLLAAPVVAALLLAGCASGNSAGASDQTATKAAGTLSGDLTVYAAASLTASFDELAKKFHALHPGVTVKPIDYDGSSTLATQLRQGAPADVFASADQASMNRVESLIDAGSTVFARNTLEIAVPPGNPKRITGLSDLASSDLKVVLCAPQVPCGAASHTLLDADGISVKPASEEQNVTAVITKVKAGEADAGLVYVTDVEAAAGAVHGVKIPDADKAVNEYPIATMKAAQNAQAGKAFTKFVLSAAGQKVLAKYGFAKP